MLAPAKLNLYLEVVGKRPDGYHELATLFQTVDWGDEVEGGPAADLLFHVVSVGWKGAYPDGDPGENLVLGARNAWVEAGGRRGSSSFHVHKRIPIGGGLAGGSTDAAAVLRLLQRGGDALPPARLLEVARSLGSDVPFLLTGGSAIGRGRGDVIEPLPPPPPVAFVLAMPPFGTETARVYGNFGPRLRPAPKGGLEKAVAALASGDPRRIRDAHHNDLAEAAMRAYPDLRRFMVDVERRLGRPPCLTGSGSTLFDLPDAGGEADVLARLEGLPGLRRVVHATGPLP